jgi:hypothetical protein
MNAGTRDASPGLLAHLRGLEEDLLRLEIRRSPAELEARLAPDFAEIGRSGRGYDRAALIAALAHEEPAAIVISDFGVRVLAPEVALATYHSRATGADGRPVLSLRSSIWRRDAGRWLLVFHQGTPTG